MDRKTMPSAPPPRLRVRTKSCRRGVGEVETQGERRGSRGRGRRRRRGRQVGLADRTGVIVLVEASPHPFGGPRRDVLSMVVVAAGRAGRLGSVGRAGERRLGAGWEQVGGGVQSAGRAVESVGQWAGWQGAPQTRSPDSATGHRHTVETPRLRGSLPPAFAGGTCGTYRRAGGRSVEVGVRRSEEEGRRTKVGGRRSEHGIGGRRSEVGGRWSEVGGRRSGWRSHPNASRHGPLLSWAHFDPPGTARHAAPDSKCKRARTMC